jgi:hypothetical protein
MEGERKMPENTRELIIDAVLIDFLNEKIRFYAQKKVDTIGYNPYWEKEHAKAVASQEAYEEIYNKVIELGGRPCRK